MDFKRTPSADSLGTAHSVYSSNTPTRSRSNIGSRTSLSVLPSLPKNVSNESIEEDLHNHSNIDEKLEREATPENSYVEFDLLSMDQKNSKNDSNFVSEKIISPNAHTTDNSDVEDDKDEVSEVAKKPEDTENDFFNMKTSDWKSMKTITEQDYYNDKGELEYEHANEFDPSKIKFDAHGYTKIDTEEQVAKYAELDKKTDFLFQNRREINKKTEAAAYRKEDLDYASDEENSEYEDDDNLDSNETLQTMRNMLTDGQKFAYVGTTKLIAFDMATELAKIKQSTSNKVAKELSLGQRNFANWTMYITSKLYEHMNLSKDEQNMIENLSKHGVEVTDLCNSLNQTEIIKPSQQNRTQENETDNSKKEKTEKPDNNEVAVDLRWTIICDLLLLLLSDGYYDSRSRSLLVLFAESMGISHLEILQFERRLIESLEIDTNNKSIENKDEKLNDREFIDKYKKKNKKKRYAYIGLATLGGSLAIGLSAGLLAPVIGLGIAGGLTTVGISGTSGFLAGVGGSAIITTGGIVTGAKVGSKAGARRLGDVNTFELKPLYNTKRTNLIITVSGWMNGKMDDVRLPFSTVDPVMGDMFSLLWEPEMLQSMGQTIGILATEALSTSIQQILGATVLSALMAAIQVPMVLSKLTYLLDNPWSVSLDRAWKGGKILADTLISGNMGVRPITLVGFSLGARLIYSCLIELAKRGGYGLIENVIILGCPITIKNDQLGLARSVVSGRFVNGFSKRDWILGYLFRATGGGILSVAGLSPIESVYGIENIDCTDIVEGHMAYRKAIPKILKAINWEILSEEFAEIEEPDPEQHERERKLVDEFDEARAKMKEEMDTETSKKKTWKNFFKPNQKDWWNVYSEGKSKGTDANEPYTDPSEELNQPDTQTNNPIFDVTALLEEANNIERLAENDPETLETMRKEVDTSAKHTKLNEEVEEEEKSTNIVNSLANKFGVKKDADPGTKD
ncbi:unnamed protein product [Debaryomyces tyrocola]|nr:unnamed protein product [Debaryomyces tyrocola]